jgi:hypothetical protein
LVLARAELGQSKRISFHFRPGDARLCAICPLGPFNRPGVFHILDRLTPPAQPGFGLYQLFVQLIPIDSN